MDPTKPTKPTKSTPESIPTNIPHDPTFDFCFWYLFGVNSQH